MDKMEHKQRVEKMIKRERDLVELITQKTTQKFTNGPRKPHYAEGKHKSVVYLSGTNIVLLKKMVRDEKKADPWTKVTKSVILNRMVEYFLENHTNAKSRKIQKRYRY